MSLVASANSLAMVEARVEPESNSDFGRPCELPMMKVTAMVSPNARPRPSMTAPMALLRTKGSSTCQTTSMEVVWQVLLPFVRKSAIGAVMLGLGRALGETMAVTFIIGNSHGLPKSLFDSGSTLASTIANEFAEATSDMHTSALIALGLVLFLITFAVLALARALLGAQRSY